MVKKPHIQSQSPTLLRTAIYARVSTADQHPENQVRSLRKYIESRGWICTHELIDTASGASRDRPSLKSLMKLAYSRQIDAVVVSQLDRLGRSLTDLLSTLGEFESLGVEFVSLADSIDTSTASGKMFLKMRAIFAEYERDLIIERVRDGQQRAKADGIHIGRPKSLPVEDIQRRLQQGDSPSVISRELGIHRSSVYAVKKIGVSRTTNETGLR